MVAVSTPRTWGTASGQPPDFRDMPNYVIWNQELYTNIEFLLNPPLVKLAQNTVQSMTTGATAALSWDIEEADTDNMHSLTVNPTRITPQTAGWYIGMAGGSWKALNTASDTTGRRILVVRKNGNTFARRDVRGHTGINRPRVIKGMPFVVFCNGSTDYIEMAQIQDSGVTYQTEVSQGIELWPEFYMRWYRAL